MLTLRRGFARALRCRGLGTLDAVIQFRLRLEILKRFGVQLRSHTNPSSLEAGTVSKSPS